MRYSRSELQKRKWHKIVWWRRKSILVEACERHLQPNDYMLSSGGDWLLVMIAEDNDFIAIKLAVGITQDEYRGYGDWSKKKYWCAKTNRIQ